MFTISFENEKITLNTEECLTYLREKALSKFFKNKDDSDVLLKTREQVLEPFDSSTILENFKSAKFELYDVVLKEDSLEIYGNKAFNFFGEDTFSVELTKAS